MKNPFPLRSLYFVPLLAVLSFGAAAHGQTATPGIDAQGQPPPPPPAPPAPVPLPDDPGGAVNPPGPPANFVDISPSWNGDVLDAINQCKKSMACPTLLGFKTAKPDAFKWLQGWCAARGTSFPRPNADETAVCSPLAKPTPTDQELAAVSILQMARLARRENRPNCSGFGITIPLYSIRYKDGSSEVKGPVKAGLGGGYYWGLACEQSFSFGPEVFGYSEGLDPSGLFHVGVATGLQFVAFSKFQFGLAVGYDLYRRQPDDASTSTSGAAMTVPTVTRNGLFTGAVSKQDWSVLLTFSIVGGENKKDE